jgi:hypothetical protein
MEQFALIDRFASGIASLQDFGASSVKQSVVIVALIRVKTLRLFFCAHAST